MNKINAGIQFRTLYTNVCDTIFKNYLEPKRIQLIPLKLQYQKSLSDFSKKKMVEAYEFHLM